MQQAQVVVGVVEDDLDRRVGQQLAERAEPSIASGSTTAVSSREEICSR